MLILVALLCTVFTVSPVQADESEQSSANITIIQGKEHSYTYSSHWDVLWYDGYPNSWVLAHPLITHPFYKYSFEGTVNLGDRYIGIEVLNAPVSTIYGISDNKSFEYWDRVNIERVKKGLPLLWGFACDDTHAYVHIGKQWLLVDAENDPSSIFQALNAGYFYFGNLNQLPAEPTANVTNDYFTRYIYQVGDNASYSQPFLNGDTPPPPVHKLLRGNMHTHTTESGVPITVDEMAAAYAAHGYDFLAITNYDYELPPPKQEETTAFYGGGGVGADGGSVTGKKRITGLLGLLDSNMMLLDDIEASDVNVYLYLNIAKGTKITNKHGQIIPYIIVEELTETPCASQNITFITSAFKVGTPGLTFDPGAVLTIRDRENKAQGGLILVRLEGDCWVALDSQQQGNSASVNIDRYGIYALADFIELPEEPTPVETPTRVAEWGARVAEWGASQQVGLIALYFPELAICYV